MILTPDQKSLLLARLQQPDMAGLAASAAAAALSTRAFIPNPTPRGTVPKPFTIDDLMGELDAAALAKVYARPGLVQFRTDVDAANVPDVLRWLQLALAGGDITQAQHDAMVAVATATEPDPAWPATVAAPSWAEANFGGIAFLQPDGTTLVNEISAAMVTEARS